MKEFHVFFDRSFGFLQPRYGWQRWLWFWDFNGSGNGYRDPCNFFFFNFFIYIFFFSPPVQERDSFESGRLMGRFMCIARVIRHGLVDCVFCLFYSFPPGWVVRSDINVAMRYRRRRTLAQILISPSSFVFFPGFNVRCP
ncbi:hypothetical protein B0T13DRAFT_29422 [Neurospora crassa]|nr:hypothetical protein B0T13DRAFT_29422 [Neurospora crassa]